MSGYDCVNRNVLRRCLKIARDVSQLIECLTLSTNKITNLFKSRLMVPHAGYGVVRIDPLRFLAGGRKKRLNQALSVLSLSLGFL